ncbi:MAG TPA: beta-ketoacyl-ACP synthase 3 [Ktedonobacteraceae bacterium]|nr:beta-ketoacyl-ACP synthase 3 [Ktedonobacteraceae bacterium]
MLPVKLAGLGWYLPERRVTNAELEARLDIPENWIERLTGVCERRYASDETMVSMGAAASCMALANADIAVHELDAIVSASTAPQQAIPCTATFLQRALQAPEGASACFDINATCLSFPFALQMVAHLVAAGVYRNVLICSSELASHSLNPRERESAALFGDAAAAAVVTRSQPGEASAIWHTQFATYSSGADLTAIVGGGLLHHPNDPTTTPEMNLFHMHGPAVYRQASQVIEPFLERFFCALKWRREEVDMVIPHQASRHPIEQFSRRLGFTPEQVFLNLPVRGNCVSASIPLALAEAVESERVRRGDRVLLFGTGAGLTLGAVALTY